MRIAFLATAGAAAWLAAAILPVAAKAEPSSSPAAVQTRTSGQPVGSPSGQTLPYVVRPGDSLRSIAIAAFHRVDDWRQVQTLNGVADPLRLRVGMTLRLPVGLLRTRPVQARLVSFRGDVTLRQGGGAAAARIGAMVSEGAEIETGGNASARLALPDGGVVAVPSMSRVRFARLRAYVVNGATEQEITILNGRSEFQVSPVRAPGGFRVGTPLSASAVRGTEFRVGYDGGADRSSTEVLGGSVHVAPEGLEPLIAAPRQGVAIADGRAQLVDLLAEPAWEPGNAVQAGADITFAITPEAGAELYRAVVASDAGFVNIVGGGQSRPDETRIDVFPLPDGPYFVRLTAVSPLGVEGMPADYPFVRALNTVSGMSAEDQGGRRLAFFWSAPPKGAESYRFQLARVGGEVIVDRPDLTRAGVIVPDLAKGDYEWRVMARWNADGREVDSWSRPRTLSVP